jgi:hypothetical protein
MVDVMTLFVECIDAFFWVLCAALAAMQLYIVICTTRRGSTSGLIMGLPAYAVCSMLALASKHPYYIWSAGFITSMYVTTSAVMIAHRPE